jgi:benzoate-CoA ligase
MCVDVIDGIGSTEMLHIFISNVPGAVRYGTTGKVVAGYQARLLDEQGNCVTRGEPGDLWVSGPTCCVQYWNHPEKTAQTFVDGWMRTGDKFRETEDGEFIHCGRSDDLLKVGGIWVSPLEVEAALMRHEAVLDAAVVGWEDEQRLVKPKAFVVLRDGVSGGMELEEQLKGFVKTQLAPYKYPRWIEFVNALPRTATGKLQRFRLRTGMNG